MIYSTIKSLKHTCTVKCQRKCSQTQLFNNDSFFLSQTCLNCDYSKLAANEILINGLGSCRKT